MNISNDHLSVESGARSAAAGGTVAGGAAAASAVRARAVRSLADGQPGWKQPLRDYYDLAKPGIGFYALISTFAAFWLASGPTLDVTLLLHTIIATALVASGGGALNQVMEIEADSKMRRTENRPLPSGRVSRSAGAFFGGACAAAGLIWMGVAVGPLATLLSALTLVGYLSIYTPLKRKSHLSTVVGAFPGAFPILIGWVAVTGSIDIRGWTLFAILFLWQIPHFLAIAWMYRKDYARAGFPMITVVDAGGMSTSRQVTLYALALIPVSLMPTVLGMTGWVYFGGAFVIGVAFAYIGIRTAFDQSNTSARKLLFASIIYLPVILALMVLDKA